MLYTALISPERLCSFPSYVLQSLPTSHERMKKKSHRLYDRSPCMKILFLKRLIPVEKNKAPGTMLSFQIEFALLIIMIYHNNL